MQRRPTTRTQRPCDRDLLSTRPRAASRSSAFAAWERVPDEPIEPSLDHRVPVRDRGRLAWLALACCPAKRCGVLETDGVWPRGSAVFRGARQRLGRCSSHQVTAAIFLGCSIGVSCGVRLASSLSPLCVRISAAHAYAHLGDENRGCSPEESGCCALRGVAWRGSRSIGQ